MMTRFALAAVCVLLMVCPRAHGAQGAASPGGRGTLNALLDEHVEAIFRADPLEASRRGDARFNDAVPDYSPEGIAAQRAGAAARLARLRALSRDGFSEEDHLHADLLEYELTTDLAGGAFFPEQMPINSMDGPHVWLPQWGTMIPVRSAREQADYAARLEKIPTLIDQMIAQMRLGLAAGRTPARLVLAHAVAGCAAQASPAFVENPGASPFFAPWRSLPEAEQNALAVARARRAISEGIVPAFARMAAFLEREYIPACRESIACADLPDGRAMYDQRLRYYTTTNMTAAQIHDTGLREVARLRGLMLDLIAQTDFPNAQGLTGDALFAAFLAYLRSDPRFYFTSEAEMLAGYRDLCKRIDPELPRLFRTLPRNTYGVRAIPRFAAPTSPAAYCYPGSIRSGVPGYFMVNTHKLDQRPKYGMISLTIHEAVPGHHFQLAIADELENVHPFRTLTSYTAFVEGWALYSEKLGLEMDPGPDMRRLNTGAPRPGKGFYTDPYDDFGRLSDEIWRACRLVVDTGMHALGWPRERALRFMLENTAGTEIDTNSEINRYISWPGQACAYKIGELAISGYRARAQEELKEAFDIREFHDCILSGGALPLPVLEKRVDRWIESRRAGG